MKWIAVCALLTLSGSALADDAAWTYVGGAGDFSHNKQIRMVSERVRADLDTGRSHFHATFVFRNEGPATIVTMAFPEESHRDHALTTGVIHDFWSGVDGKAVKARRLRLRADNKSGSEYRAVWLKKVQFGAHQTRRVAVDYWAENGDVGDLVTNYYILTSGATWKGSIGDCLITIDWSRLRNVSPPSFYLSQDSRDTPIDGNSVGSKTFELRFHDFEPDFNVQMNWSNGFWNMSYNGAQVSGTGYEDRVPILSGDGDDPMIAIRYAADAFNQGERDQPEDSSEVPALGVPFEIGSHEVRLLGGRTIEVDGKRKLLHRKSQLINDMQSVYLRDIVEAVGGRYRYDPKLDRAQMWAH